MIELIEVVEIGAPIERCFDLARSVDVHVASSVTLGGRADAGRIAGLSQHGDETTWSARFFGLRFRVTTRIVSIERPSAFKETIISGLPKRFEHSYSFEALPGERTILTDRFTIESPFGVIGYVFDRCFLGPKMSRALKHRCEFLRQLAESTEWKKYLP